MNKKFRTFGVSILLVFAGTTFAMSQMSRETRDDLYSQIELFSYALTTIQHDYVEEKSPKDLIYGSLKGMLGSLDPHSQFLDPDEYKELKTETQGKFGGLGIEISIRDGLLTVITPIEDTPAWNAGIRAGDRIVKIGDELTRDINLSDAVKMLRGDPETDVTITILREDEYKLLELTVTRKIIHIQDVKNTQILQNNIGYIRLAEFRENSHKEFRKALDTLQKDGADALILDLRNNPGGLLNVAIQITEEFLTQGQIIVSTQSRRASQNTETKSTNKNHLIDWPMVVLINEGSASGSEILAGALKDHNRAIILGTKSFGKGSVQSVIPLPDGSGLRLTTSRYYTPSGVSIHGTGIEPDINVKRIYQEPSEDDKKDTDINKIFEDVEKKDAPDPAALELTKKEKETREALLADNQVQSAISVLQGIKVYKKIADGSPITKNTTVSVQ